MSLAHVLRPAPTKHGMQEWALSHYYHHLAIINAVRQTKGIILPILPIYPFDENKINIWLNYHEQMHDSFNAVFNNIGNDLTTLNFRDERQRNAFFFLNYIEHQSAAKDSGLPI